MSISYRNSIIPFLRNELQKFLRTFKRWRILQIWLVFMIKRIIKNYSWRPEVHVGDNLELASMKISLRKLLKLKRIHESIATALELKFSNIVKMAHATIPIVEIFVSDGFCKNKKSVISDWRSDVWGVVRSGGAFGLRNRARKDRAKDHSRNTTRIFKSQNFQKYKNENKEKNIDMKRI